MFWCGRELSFSEYGSNTGVQTDRDEVTKTLGYEPGEWCPKECYYVLIRTAVSIAKSLLCS